MEKIISKITDEDFGLPLRELDNPTICYGVRGIVVNEEGEIAIFNKHFKNEYKLPGGGIEKDENIIDAFKREIMEETGCEISNIKKLGITIEEKGQTNFCQISYIFIANVIKNTHMLHMTKKEQDEGGEILWLSPREAYANVSNSINNVIGSIYDDRYKSMFMVKRDAMILSYYLELKKEIIKFKKS